MSSRRTRKLILAGVAFATLAGGAAQPARAAAIKFCVDKANPMASVDEKIATAAAAQSGVGAALVLRDSSQDDEDEDSGNAQVKFLHRLAQTCDIILGFPVERQEQTLPDGMAASQPYVSTGFVVATTNAPIGQFSDMAREQTLGVVMLTVASTYFTEHNMAHEHVFYSNEQLYNALLGGEVNAALIWQPWLERELTAHPRNLHVARLNMPHAAWNIVALYPKTAQNPLAAREFNNGISALAASGKLNAAIQPYTPPYVKQ